jgi:transcriptional regulator with XRE-family HTH domain
MENNKLSVRDAAQIAGVPPSTLANWRAGASPDNHLALKRLSDHFGVSLAFLLTGEHEKFERPDESLRQKIREDLACDCIVLENSKLIIQICRDEKT